MDYSHPHTHHPERSSRREGEMMPLVMAAAHELETLRSAPLIRTAHSCLRMPEACQRLVLSLPGNRQCVDCGAANPDWASVSFGTLLCLRCSGTHRSYGVHTSVVRSVRMDAWTHAQALSMLEGGNDQLRRFFQRHHLLGHVDPPHNSSHPQHDNNSASLSKVSNQRYHTKAAQFYRDQLGLHVQRVSRAGLYPGREARRPRRNNGLNHPPTCPPTESQLHPQQPHSHSQGNRQQQLQTSSVKARQRQLCSEASKKTQQEPTLVPSTSVIKSTAAIAVLQ